jgi:hypothetical protein
MPFRRATGEGWSSSVFFLASERLNELKFEAVLNGD